MEEEKRLHAPIATVKQPSWLPGSKSQIKPPPFQNLGTLHLRFLIVKSRKRSKGWYWWHHQKSDVKLMHLQTFRILRRMSVPGIPRGMPLVCPNDHRQLIPPSSFYNWLTPYANAEREGIISLFSKRRSRTPFSTFPHKRVDFHSFISVSFSLFLILHKWNKPYYVFRFF